MEGNIKLLGADGMCGMEFTGDKVNVYNDAGYVMESMATREHVQEVIDFLEECKEQMEQEVRLREWKRKNNQSN